MFELRSISARLILAISLLIALACGLLGSAAQTTGGQATQVLSEVEQSVAGRELKISPAMALFDGPLQATAGALVELRIEALSKPLRGRFVDCVAAGCRIQLLLDQQHLSFTEGAMPRLAEAAQGRFNGSAAPPAGPPPTEDRS
jgi:hypothetical protein